nr:unnamed protein product [Callosobruchus analis]
MDIISQKILKGEDSGSLKLVGIIGYLLTIHDACMNLFLKQSICRIGKNIPMTCNLLHLPSLMMKVSQLWMMYQAVHLNHQVIVERNNSLLQLQKVILFWKN